MAASLGEQRHVVPQALIPVVSAEVEDLEAAAGGELGIPQVGTGLRHLHFGDVEGPVFDAIDDEEDAHVAGSIDRRFAS
jgi:hypothetical protein